MNKKYYSLIFASALLLATASCSQDEQLVTKPREVTSFRINLENGGVQSRSGEGSAVANLYYEVYQGTDMARTKVLDNYGDDANADPVTVENSMAVVEMPLLRGESYDIIFWAQSAVDESIYNPADLQNIEVDYTKAMANKDAYDAFFYGQKGFQATTNETTIELRRPFGQLNIGTTYNDDENNLGDWQKAISMVADKTVLPVTSSQIVVQGLANRFNALTHVASVEGEVGAVTYQAAELIDERFKVVNENVETQYQSLGMNYLLVPSSETETDEYIHKDNLVITASFNRGSKQLFTINLPNVPVQRNWRTNIIGELLAADKTFQVIIVPDFDGDEIYPDTPEEEVYMKAAIGGEVTLTENLTLSSNFYVQSDMVINLNGKTLTYEGTDPIMARVVNGATLTINGGDGSQNATSGQIISAGYIASARENSKVIVNGGTFSTTSTTLFQADGGKVYIKDGYFSNENQTYGATYLLNHIDSKKEIGLIEVTGGTFVGYNPAESASENPVMSFLPANGEYESYEKDGQWQVMIKVVPFVDKGEYAEVATAEGLLKWAYIVNKTANKNGYGLKLMRDIEMPALTIGEDAANETYVFTETPITVDENGVPSGSNWVPIRTGSGLTSAEAYHGEIEGNSMTISGLRIVQDATYTGFVGFMYGYGSIRNITMSDAIISGKTAVGSVCGFSQHGSMIENVSVINSFIQGSTHVGGVVGYIYRKLGQNAPIDEEFAYVNNCSTDVNTKVKGTGDNVGGICGYNYGSIVVGCVNNADVIGRSNIGGVVGYCRDYWSNSEGTVIADAYLIACHSGKDAKVEATASSGNVGGIVGHSFGDAKNHPHTKLYVVACTSEANVIGKNKGAIIGYVQQKTTVISSWAKKVENLNLVGVKDDSETIESSLFTEATEITEDVVEKMNEAIASFNNSNAEQVQCPYTWHLTSSSWPTLVKSSNE